MDKKVSSRLISILEWLLTGGCIAFSLLADYTDGVNIRHNVFAHLLTSVLCVILLLEILPAFKKEIGSVNGPLFFLLFIIAGATVIGAISLRLSCLIACMLLYLYFNRNKLNHRNRPAYEAALLFSIWLLLLGSFEVWGTGITIKAFLYFAPLSAIINYLFIMYSILPWLWKFKSGISKFISTAMLLTAASTATLYALVYMYTPWAKEYIHTKLYTFHLAIQLLLVYPLCWVLYGKRQEANQSEIFSLRKELGKSDANLQFLRSQINPHFLFNALNTIYASAIKEKAEETGEGILMLGNMMRVMLQENMEDQILLSRDLEYLKNYICFQQLRLKDAETVTITLQLDEPNQPFFIAPMLLIPFVENAFKHGISLASPSHINISLHLNGENLYLDVHNSRHSKSDTDPEKNRNGIGLENIKQRLHLLYPDKHELVIRELPKDFYAHLTLQLTTTTDDSNCN